MEQTSHKDPDYQKEQAEMVVSYMVLRKCVGIIGISLPFILIIFNSLYFGQIDVQHAISAYYHTIVGDLFVGIICLISAILITYRGKDKDYLWLRIAAFLALLVAFFPTTPDTTIQEQISIATKNCQEKISCSEISDNLTWTNFNKQCQLPAHFNNQTIEFIHFASAVLFFIILAYVILCLFTKSRHSKEEIKTKYLQKHRRNNIYTLCGFTIIGALLIGLVYFIIVGLGGERPDFANKYNIVFWIESICLWAFGIAWLVKGQAFYKDAVQTNH